MTCKTCGAPIIWTKTKAGKAAPIDAEATPEGNIIVYRAGGEIKSDVLSKDRLDVARLAGARLHTSHFVTCAQADSHRRKK